MTQHKPVLTNEEMHALICGNPFTLGLSIARLKDFIRQVEKAVVDKLHEQEPLAWYVANDVTFDQQTAESWKKNLFILKPLYENPSPSIVSDKIACVSESAKSDTQRHLSYIKRYQKWRRGEDKTMDEAGLTPKQIGEALDWLIGVAENHIEEALELARNQPCGCIVCYCENQERCLGCGAKYCGTHEVGEIPNPVYVDHIADASKMVGSNHIADMRKKVPEYAEVYVGDGLFSICDWQDWNSIKGHKWSLSTRNRSGCLYAQTKVDNGDGTRSRLAMHHAILPQKDGFVIDHINGNGLDNRRDNLRYATIRQNSFNQKIRKASSIYKGVSFDRESGLWRATIGVSGKKVYGGRHETELDAAKAYDEMAKKHFGEFAVLNLVEDVAIEAAPKYTGEK